MSHDDLRVLQASEVDAILGGIETEIVDVVARAYRAHGRGASVLPLSSFVRFPHSRVNRIIALPGYVGDGFAAAGMKWIASFPANVAAGMDRASAVIVLNSIETGRPYCVLEGSVISAKRTAASAALAVRVLSQRQHHRLGLVGCGVINRETLRFLAATGSFEDVIVVDLDSRRARAFVEEARALAPAAAIAVAPDLTRVLRECSLISFATTAPTPHVQDLSPCAAGTLILHTSLRDLTPECVLSCDNVTDDIEHVCREQTSLHLAEQMVGHRRFIRCALPEILDGVATASEGHQVTVFSPFGLGVLDIALARHVYDAAVRSERGAVVPSFFPAPSVGVIQAP
jgi:ornithine cyclodeaminase